MVDCWRLGSAAREGEQLLKRKNVFFRNAAMRFLLVLLLIMSGCATSRSAGASRIREVDNATVSGCKYLGEVHGSSEVGNQVPLFASVGMEKAKNEALERASQLGGTHVVWDKLIDGYPAFAKGNVYLCVETTK